jgi:hypothetical protein
MFWTDRHFSLVRFPQLEYLRGPIFTTWLDRARSFARAETFESKEHKMHLRTILYHGRFCYSWMTGCIGSDDDAVTLLNKRPVPGSILIC